MNYTEKTQAKPKSVRLMRNGETMTLTNRQNVTFATYPQSKATISQSRQVFNQVVNTLSTVCGWTIEEIKFFE